MCFYRYELLYWNDIDEKQKCTSGYTCGKTYIEAVKRISQYYGDVNIISLTIYFEENTECGIMEDKNEKSDSGA